MLAANASQDIHMFSAVSLKEALHSYMFHFSMQTNVLVKVGIRRRLWIVIVNVSQKRSLFSVNVIIQTHFALTYCAGFDFWLSQI